MKLRIKSTIWNIRKRKTPNQNNKKEKELKKKNEDSARFGSTYTKIGTIQRRLAWPLRKDDTQIPEAFHIF